MVEPSLVAPSLVELVEPSLVVIAALVESSPVESVASSLVELVELVVGSPLVVSLASLGEAVVCGVDSVVEDEASLSVDGSPSAGKPGQPLKSSDPPIQANIRCWISRMDGN
ncbi:hypothetical protein [Nannocystis exedens]|uniref:hypothetical protein n=1 Tax=Nannocystis exedens TaxID=54 RepID=UPI000BB9FEB4|nr:hypothetical protein [Nannocystis exedens]